MSELKALGPFLVYSLTPTLSLRERVGVREFIHLCFVHSIILKGTLLTFYPRALSLPWHSPCPCGRMDKKIEKYAKRISKSVKVNSIK